MFFELLIQHINPLVQSEHKSARIAKISIPK